MLLTVSVFKCQATLEKLFVSTAILLALTIGVVPAVYPKPPLSTPAPVILVYGDSISAAYGMETKLGWVNLLSERLVKNSLNYSVINASISGETTGGGLIRLAKTLEIYQPDIVILELGGNDGLRGYPISKIEANLNTMTRMAQAAKAKVLLIGMVLPPNYGPRYTQSFEALFNRVSNDLEVPLLPFILKGVATQESLMQRDGIHPKPEAQALILNDIWQHLKPLF